jgi:glycosyltransferase involved in cell wall biosynthesis
MKKLKICFHHVSTGIFTGGIESYVIGLANFFEGLGHKVSIVKGKGKNKGLNKKIRVFSFPFISRNSKISLFIEKISPSFLTRFQIECFSLWLFSWIHYLKNDYDVVHCHQKIDAIILNFLKKFKRKKFKTVLTIHGFPTSIFNDKLKTIDLIICTSNEVRKNFKLKHENIKVITNFVNTKVFKPLNEKELKQRFVKEKKFLILFFGRLEKWKGVQVLLKAIELLKKEGFSLKLLIIGSGSFEKKLKILTKKLGLKNEVIFFGSIENNELPRFLNASDVIVLPSIEKEAFSFAVLEGMACGKPVIASNLGGTKEQIIHGFNGMLFEPGNFKELAKQIKTILTNKELREKILENARKNAVKYSVNKIGEKILGAYLK